MNTNVDGLMTVISGLSRYVKDKLVLILYGPGVNSIVIGNSCPMSAVVALGVVITTLLLNLKLNMPDLR